MTHVPSGARFEEDERQHSLVIEQFGPPNLNARINLPTSTRDECQRSLAFLRKLRAEVDRAVFAVDRDEYERFIKPEQKAARAR